MQLRHALALSLAACQASPAAHTGFGGASEITIGSSTDPAASSSDHSTSSGTTGLASDPGDNSTATTAEPARDLGGMPDFGDGAPSGCQGKIDFLFVLSRAPYMELTQARLAAAFPQFIATIQSKFAGFDYHIMVVTGDNGWGNDACTELCTTPDCRVGEPCCPWNDPNRLGQLCCIEPDYPCNDLGILSGCDRTWGAGEIFPAGVDGEANKPCPVDGNRRYLVKGQTNLPDTFQCIATVGSSGYGWLGQALVAAVDEPMNKLGGCNPGFLRDDALLMVTFIEINPDETGMSAGSPASWAQTVIDAKHGDDKSVVMLSIFRSDDTWEPADRIGTLAKMFPYHLLEHWKAEDYGPAFIKAANLVETACAGFAPPR